MPVFFFAMPVSDDVVGFALFDPTTSKPFRHGSCLLCTGQREGQSIRQRRRQQAINTVFWSTFPAKFLTNYPQQQQPPGRTNSSCASSCPPSNNDSTT